MTLIITKPTIKINNVALNDNVSQVEISQNWAEVDTTTFDGSRAMSRVAGLEDSSISITFLQDFAASSVDATISPLVAGTATFEILPNGTAVGATNPKYTGTVLVNTWTPLSGAPGDRSEVDVEWPVVGKITRATS